MVWYGVGKKGESKKESEGSTSHLYHSICTTSHAPGSSPSLQAQRSWWTIGKPKSSAHVTLSSSRGRAHTHRSLRAQEQICAVRMMSWSASGRFTYPGALQARRLISLLCKPVFRDMRHAKSARPSATMGDVGKKYQPRRNTQETRHTLSWSYGRLLALRLEYIFMSIFQ